MSRFAVKIVKGIPDRKGFQYEIVTQRVADELEGFSEAFKVRDRLKAHDEDRGSIKQRSVKYQRRVAATVE